MDVRHAVGAAAFTGLVAAGLTLTGSDAVPAQFEVDGVAITALNSADYMPPPRDPDVITVDGVSITVLESSDYMPPPLP